MESETKHSAGSSRCAAGGLGKRCAAVIKKEKPQLTLHTKTRWRKRRQKNDPSATKLAITLAKNKQHNAILDLNEEFRLSKHALNQATLSSDEIYKSISV